MTGERLAISRAFGAEVLMLGDFHANDALAKVAELGRKPGHFAPQQFDSEWNIEENATWLAHRPAVDDHRDEDERLLPRRVLAQSPRRRRQDPIERAKSGLDAVAPCESGCRPHALSPLSTASATRAM